MSVFHRVLVPKRPSRQHELGEVNSIVVPAGFGQYCNRQRPHEALGQKTPAQRYRRSPRKLPDAFADAAVYAAGNRVRQVRSNGEIGLGQDANDSSVKRLVGQPIGLRQLKPNIHAVRFRQLVDRSSA